MKKGDLFWMVLFENIGIQFTALNKQETINANDMCFLSITVGFIQLLL